MTQEEQEMSPQEFADAFKKLNEAEQAAAVSIVLPLTNRSIYIDIYLKI